MVGKTDLSSGVVCSDEEIGRAPVGEYNSSHPITSK
jgi:hypothetical protein